MQKLPAWVVYNVWRILFIAIPLAILLFLLPSYWGYDAVAAVIIGLCLSFILLGGQRTRMIEGMRNADSKRKPAKGDAALEDSLLDGGDSGDKLGKLDFNEAVEDEPSPHALATTATTAAGEETDTAGAAQNFELPTSQNSNSET